MRNNKILILILVFSILFVNSIFVFAEEEEEYNSQVEEVNEQNTSNNSRSINPSVNVDTSNYNGYIKPATDQYDDGDGVI